MVKPVQTGSKKPYSTPKLTVYGTVHQLTKSHATRGNRDNTRRPATFTRF